MPVTATQGDAAVARRIAISVGYLLAPDLVGYEQVETANGGHQLVLPIGNASQSAFPDMFAKLFTSTRAISVGQDALPRTEGVDAVIVPRLIESTIQGPDVVDRASSISDAAARSLALSDIENRFLTDFPSDSSIQRWLRSTHAAAS